MSAPYAEDVPPRNGPARGEYVTGWIKRGPRGIIGTNKACALETVTQRLRDLPDLPRALHKPSGLRQR
jgi:ferredoxin--NADP+ reductase